MQNERNSTKIMVLSQEQREKLHQRLVAVADFGGEKRVAEAAGLTVRVIQKAKAGGNIRVKTLEAIMNGLRIVETERRKKMKKLVRALK
ncbi:hypothetical protein [Larkinella soli]|uniref:hypothetical protein n=1 Tax=Larkinella soli TaxID=1770527 RepID=UPI000FFB837E|nr:hypothetical protein [Larkinella soli]